MLLRFIRKQTALTKQFPIDYNWKFETNQKLKCVIVESLPLKWILFFSFWRVWLFFPSEQTSANNKLWKISMTWNSTRTHTPTRKLIVTVMKCKTQTKVHNRITCFHYSSKSQFANRKQNTFLWYFSRCNVNMCDALAQCPLYFRGD